MQYIATIEHTDSAQPEEPHILNTREEVHALITGLLLGEGEPIERATGTATAILDHAPEGGFSLRTIRGTYLGVECKDSEHALIHG